MTRAVATSLGSVFGSTWALWPVGSILGLALPVTTTGFYVHHFWTDLAALFAPSFWAHRCVRQ